MGLEPKLATSRTQPTHPPKLCKHCYFNKLTCFFQHESYPTVNEITLHPRNSMIKLYNIKPLLHSSAHVCPMICFTASCLYILCLFDLQYLSTKIASHLWQFFIQHHSHFHRILWQLFKLLGFVCSKRLRVSSLESPNTSRFALDSFITSLLPHTSAIRREIGASVWPGTLTKDDMIKTIAVRGPK